MLWPTKQILHTAPTESGSIVVLEDRTTRSLHFDNGPVQSRMYLADPYSLALTYTRHLMGCLLFRPEPERVLQIGLGGGSAAKFLWHHFPEIQVEVIEQSPEVVEIAYEYFDLPRDSRLMVRVGDGAEFVCGDRTGAGYDLLMVDAYEAHQMCPRVAQQGFVNACREHLAPGGVLAMNLWSGRRAAYRAALESLALGFENRVLCLPVPGKANVIALAFEAEPELSVRRLRPIALALADRLAMDFGRFLRQLQRSNLPKDGRLVLSR